MSFIPNFPPALLEEHRIWHHQHHVVPGTMPPPGFGDQFMRFHRNYINRVYDWYVRQGYDTRLIAPWNDVPDAIKYAPCYNQAAVDRIRYNPRSFATLDEFGRFLESSGVHGCLHAIAAQMYNEPDIDDFDLAPRQTVFYNIHFMIDNWYRNWEAAWGVRDNNKMRSGTNTASIKYNYARSALSQRNSRAHGGRIASRRPFLSRAAGRPHARKSLRLRRTAHPARPRTVLSAHPALPRIHRPLLPLAARARRAAGSRHRRIHHSPRGR